MAYYFCVFTIASIIIIIIRDYIKRVRYAQVDQCRPINSLLSDDIIPVLQCFYTFQKSMPN